MEEQNGSNATTWTARYWLKRILTGKIEDFVKTPAQREFLQLMNAVPLPQAIAGTA